MDDICELLLMKMVMGACADHPAYTSISLHRAQAAIEAKAEVPAAEQRLIYKGKVLKDEQTLKFYGTFCSTQNTHACVSLL